jgi:ribosomal protein S21
MIFVKAVPGDTTESLIRKFTRKVISEGLLLELKRKEFYQKPAEIRKEAKKEVERRQRASQRARARRNK